MLLVSSFSSGANSAFYFLHLWHEHSKTCLSMLLWVLSEVLEIVDLANCKKMCTRGPRLLLRFAGRIGHLDWELLSAVTRILRHTLQCKGDQDTRSWTPALETDCLHLFVVSLKQRLGHSSSDLAKSAGNCSWPGTQSDCFFLVLPCVQGRQTTRWALVTTPRNLPLAALPGSRNCWRFLCAVHPQGRALPGEIKPSWGRSKETCCAGVCTQNAMKAHVCGLRFAAWCWL